MTVVDAAGIAWLVGVFVGVGFRALAVFGRG